ncbi:MAG: type II secretion system F family protein [Ilumatobacter sp.]
MVAPLLVLVIVAVIRPRVRRMIAGRAQQRRIDAALPDAIEMLILVVQAGLTPHQGVMLLCDRAPTPIRPALHEVRRRMSRGAPLAEALDALPDLLGHDAAIVADTLAMAERYGTPIARALDQLALDVRERRRRRAEADARKLPIKMAFPLVTCTLPAFVLIAIAPAVMAAIASLNTRSI